MGMRYHRICCGVFERGVWDMAYGRAFGSGLMG
jgi:hypothetical protein